MQRKPQVRWSNNERDAIIKQTFLEMKASGETGAQGYKSPILPYIRKAQKNILNGDRYREYLKPEEIAEFKHKVHELFTIALQQRTRAAAIADNVVMVSNDISKSDHRVAELLSQVYRRPQEHILVVSNQRPQTEDPMELIMKGVTLMIEKETKRLMEQMEAKIADMNYRHIAEIRALRISAGRNT